MVYRNPKPLGVPNSNWGQSRVFPSTCTDCSIGRSLYVVGNATSNVRNYSKSVDEGFVNVKQLTEECSDMDQSIDRHRDDTVVGVEGENVNNENSGGLKEESETEKEAWKLLQEVVVTYCGSPVGTLAANDPNDAQPLNYDQVFIRDFVPSALAFLLKGEVEIVKNFLIHTMQLQVFNYQFWI